MPNCAKVPKRGTIGLAFGTVERSACVPRAVFRVLAENRPKMDAWCVSSRGKKGILGRHSARTLNAARGTRALPLVKSFTICLPLLRRGRKSQGPKIPLIPMVAPADSTIAAYDSKVEGNIIFTKMDAAINWMRKNSMWPMPMGLACCAIEMMAAACSRYDLSRFGAEVMRFSPRQADVMIVAGTVTYKMALAVKRVWDQMPEPKWCIAMGACASSGGMYRSYAVLQGIDQLIPVDVYISGCPPRPEALLEGMMRLQRKIETEHSFTEQKKELLAELTA